MSDDSLLEISKGVLLFIPPPDRVAGWRRSGNIIILNNSDNLIIIDSGGPSVRNQLVIIVNNLLTGNKRPVHCILTHGHIDHIAGAGELQKNFSATIWASKDAAPFVESQSPMNMELEQESIVVNFRELFTAPSWFVRAAMRIALGRTHVLSSVKLIFDSSEIYQSGFRSIDLPGHHHGHLGFYNKDNRILMVGDLLDPRHKMKPILTAPSSDFAGMQVSLERVLQIAPEIMIPGHGDPIFGKKTIETAIRSAQEIMKAAHDGVIEALEESKLSISELSKQLQRMGLGPGDVFRRMFIHSVLRYLINTGKVSKYKSSSRKTIFSV